MNRNLFISIAIMIPSFLFGEILFLPEEDSPFFLNSADGWFTVVDSSEEWAQSYRLETEGLGANIQLTALNLPSFSLAGKNLFLKVRTANPGEIEQFWIYAASDSDFENRIVYMISDDITQLTGGQWLSVSLPPSAGKIWGDPDLSDLKYFQFWLKDKGREAVSVDIGPVYTEDSRSGGIAVFTFDDGWISQYQRAAPLLQEFGFPATAYIIPEKIGEPGYMTKEQVLELKQNYLWSLGSHYMERLDRKEQGELITIFEKQVDFFKELGIDRPDFSYPNGAFNSTLMNLAPRYFTSARTIAEYSESLPPGDPYRLRVFNVIPGYSESYLKTRLDRAVEEGELVILIFHRISEVSEYETELPEEELRKICRLVAESGIMVQTMEDLAGYGEVHVPDFTGEERKTVPPVVPEQIISDQAGEPEDRNGIHVDFGLDWKVAMGKNISADKGSGEDFQFYSQLEDLFLYFQIPLWEGSRVYSAFGFEDVNFENITAGSIDGTLFSLKNLYLKQSINSILSVQAGYYNPDPVNKWLQVTRSAGIEPAFGEEMTPGTLWLQGILEFRETWGGQFAFSPDIVGRYNSELDSRILTYHPYPDSPALGVPNLFLSFWYNGRMLTGEAAAALNGDALKVASSGALSLPVRESLFRFSLGIKYLTSGKFPTFPDWDNADSFRVSAGISLQTAIGPLTLTPGLAYQFVVYPGWTTTQRAGLDFALAFKKLQWFTVLTCFNLSSPQWEGNTGLESGLIFDFRGVEYMAGYTMAGFNSLSGLYNNKEWNEGGINGFFLRIKATYW